MAYFGTITDILNQWADFGVFAYILPFLIIFAVVYGILDKTKLLGNNKGVNATISLAVGLISLQWDYVPLFFASIFPYTGMGISVLLIALILMGLISSGGKNEWSHKVWFGIGVVIFVVVVLAALDDMSFWKGGYLLQDAWPSILAGLILLGLVAFIIWGGKNSSSSSGGG